MDSTHFGPSLRQDQLADSVRLCHQVSGEVMPPQRTMSLYAFGVLKTNSGAR